jgi:hypothetical protein
MAKKPPDSKEPERKPPAHEIRVGRLKLTVWRNQDKERGDWYSLVLTRSYKDAQDKWHSATTLGKDDALVAAEMLRLAWLWIAAQTGSNVAATGLPGGAPQETGEDEPLPI